MFSKVRQSLLALCLITPLAAQQNLFNVPNGEITEAGHIFFQEQANVSASSAQSNTTIDYGLPGDLEVGLNLFFFNFATNSPVRMQFNSVNEVLPASPLLLANAQKGFSPRTWLRFSVGGQAGVNLGESANIRPAYLSYGTMTLIEPKFEASLHLGLYHGNTAYNGVGDGFLMGGTEIPILKQKFHFVVDVIQGSHANAVFVPGLIYYLVPSTALSIGWQKPYPGSQTEQAFVFELSIK